MGAGNALQRITFGALRNGVVDVAGVVTGVGSGCSYAVPAGSTQTSFTVRAIDTTQVVQIPFTVTDGCGDRRTFVGTGAGALQNPAVVCKLPVREQRELQVVPRLPGGRSRRCAAQHLSLWHRTGLHLSLGQSCRNGVCACALVTSPGDQLCDVTCDPTTGSIGGTVCPADMICRPNGSGGHICGFGGDPPLCTW